ncbi:alkene reductase [Paralimibaculum aggregatum]|uniref:Alkene reductase n=1 Tax=Paralimibaculum aggregatum TaxID=3036245 RepID=A0ABQ6LCG1_9RHOB|nr:alkene reductase [Limibaculum sp. NKW23]GMG81046.1 alkene reductase [Limibaculum sp. NKW23]
MAETAPLFTPLAIGATSLPNRVLMAPLTRSRAHDDGTPSELALEYYRQRASAGLIVTEATQISPEGKGYVGTPGIHSEAQVAGWKAITEAVHAAGGRIFLQLWHVGRISHTALQPGGQAPVAPSAIRANAQTFLATGPADVSAPRALETDELPRVLADFVRAAENALAAGFDGVEVHGANGYLLDAFLSDRTNRRTDRYGGSVAARLRFPLAVTEAVAKVWGADRVGLRLSPFGTANDMGDSDPEAHFSEIYRAFDRLGLAYLHVVEKFPGAEVTAEQAAALTRMRGLWRGAYIANGDFDGATAADWIARGRADAVAFGRPFIANPDLPERLRLGAALAAPDHNTFYGGDARGYTDYPFLDRKAA